MQFTAPSRLGWEKFLFSEEEQTAAMTLYYFPNRCFLGP